MFLENVHLVSFTDRLDFLHKHLGEHSLKFEKLVYMFMDKFSVGYEAVYWNFYENADLFYIAPKGNEVITLSITSNYFEESLDVNVVGIIICLYALCMLANITEDEKVIHSYHRLREFSKSTKYWSCIGRAID